MRTLYDKIQYKVRYEWDEEKNQHNQQKHRISFEDAALVFQDERCLIISDRTEEDGEQRWHAIGTVPIHSHAIAVLLVVHVYREDRYGEEIVRIISAREVEKHELRRYQKQETH